MLSDAKVRAAKQGDRPYKLADSHSLYLLVSPSGGKLWRVNYQFDSKQRTLALGPYPVVGLSDAHGERAAFSTLMNERARRYGREDDREVIHLMLAHSQPNKVEGAHKRAAYMPRRSELAQVWPTC